MQFLFGGIANIVLNLGNLSRHFGIFLLRNLFKIPDSRAAARDFSRFDEVGTVLKIDDLFSCFKD